MKGSRVQAVVQELRGEKIDIVPYDADPVKFVCNAIAPAEVARVLMDVGSHTMQLIVPDEKLSLAIGKKGQNVRLASQLTGWRIDIHSASKVTEMEARARQSLAAISGVTAEVARRCSRPAGAQRPSRGREARGADVGDRDRQRPGGAGDHHGGRSGREAERVRHAAEAARAAQQAADEAAAAASAAAAAAEAAAAAPNPEAP